MGQMGRQRSFWGQITGIIGLVNLTVVFGGETQPTFVVVAAFWDYYLGMGGGITYFWNILLFYVFQAFFVLLFV